MAGAPEGLVLVKLLFSVLEGAVFSAEEDEEVVDDEAEVEEDSLPAPSSPNKPA